MTQTMTWKVLPLLGLSALLAACNDGAGGPSPHAVTPPPPPATTAEGSWEGSIDTPAPASRGLHAVIQADGTFWMAYTRAGASTVVGVIQGQGSTSDQGFTAQGATLLSLEDNVQTTADVAATVVPQSRLEGTITAAAGGPAITLPSPAGFRALYQTGYDQDLGLADLAGTYTGTITTHLGAEQADVTVAADGHFTALSSSGCSAQGTAQAQPHGNVFNVSLTFGDEPACASNRNIAVTGVVRLDAGQITALALDSSKRNSFIFVGSRR